MKYKQHYWLAIIITILMTVLFFFYDITTSFHFIVTQLLLVQIVIGVMFYRRFVIPISIYLMIFHIIHDVEHLMAFPVDAIFDSLVQLAVLFFLLYIIKLRDKDALRMESIIEATKLGTWEWNLKTNEIIINDYWAELIGYTKKELGPITFKVWEELTHKDDLLLVGKKLELLMNKEIDFYEIETRMKHKNGEYIWVNNRGKITSWNKLGEPLIMSGNHINVNEKHKAEEKIKYNHRLMSYIIDNMNSGIAVHDKDMKYIYVSKKYLEEYNIKEDVIGKHHYQVFPDLPDKWRKVHQRCLKGEVLSDDRDEFVRADGSIDITRWECRPWYDETGEIGGIIVYTEVINDLVKIEDELINSKAMLQAVMDNLPIGIAVNTIEPSVDFSYMNEKFPEIYNTTKEQLLNGDFVDVVYEDKEFGQRLKTRILEDMASGDIERMHWTDVPITKNGKTVKYVTAYNTPLPKDGLVISTAIDSTLRKELENTLEEKANEMFIQKEEIEATLLAIGDAVISTDALGIVKNFNEIAEELTGYKKNEVVGKPFSDFFHIINETTKKKLPCPVKRVISEGQTVHLENHTVLITKDNRRRVIEDSAAPIRNQKGDLIGVILVFRDVTEKKEKQKEIEYLSIHDYLTGLYNRRFFTEKLATLDQKEHYPLGIMMIDVNGLKIINDAYGHDLGDQVLIESANAMMTVVGNRGTISRIGGDEFTIILDNTSEEELQTIKEGINEELAKHKLRNVTLTLSIGYALKSKEKENISDLMKNAENLMYKFKLADGASARNHTIKAILTTLTDKYVLERTHSERVGKLSRRLGEALKMNSDELKGLELSGLFHDIGKISIPDYILNKPSKLTKEEFEVIKEHTRNGYLILRAADEYSDLAENALLHHEHYDGNGYPEGLRGEKIPLQARIICIADAFEAMTSDRPYRKALSVEMAVEELNKYKGKQFDPNLVEVFINEVVPDEALS